MNTKLFLSSVLELFSSLVIAILILYSIYRIFKAWLLKRYSMDEGSVTFNIIISSLILAAAYLISGAIQPLTVTFKTLDGMSLTKTVYVWECFKYTLLFIIVGFVITLIGGFVTLIFFNSITKNVDEMEEAAKGKIGYAVLMSVLVIAIALFTRDAYTNILESFIPYPDLPFMPR